METYVVGGKETALDGVLFMTAGQWATLYFVPGDQGPWGSAEAGDYHCDGRWDRDDRITPADGHMVSPLGA